MLLIQSRPWRGIMFQEINKTKGLIVWVVCAPPCATVRRGSLTDRDSVRSREQLSVNRENKHGKQMSTCWIRPVSSELGGFFPLLRLLQFVKIPDTNSSVADLASPFDTRRRTTTGNRNEMARTLQKCLEELNTVCCSKTHAVICASYGIDVPDLFRSNVCTWIGTKKKTNLSLHGQTSSIFHSDLSSERFHIQQAPLSGIIFR